MISLIFEYIDLKDLISQISYIPQTLNFIFIKDLEMFGIVIHFNKK